MHLSGTAGWKEQPVNADLEMLQSCRHEANMPEANMPEANMPASLGNR